MFCSSCGTKMDPGARFCPHCGAPAEVETPQQIPLSRPPKTSSSPTARPSATPPKKKVKPFTILMIALISVLVLAIVAFVVVLLLDGVSTVEPSSAEETSVIQESIPEETIVPTEEVSSNPVPEGNPYRNFYTEAEYILPESHSRYYAPAELSDLSDQALILAAAEIPARHGIAPGEPDLQEYFSALSWYQPKSGTADLNPYEIENQILIGICQRQRDGSIYRSSNPYMAYSNHNSTYFIPNSDTQYLTSRELRNLSAQELILARNEIFARHGYIFNDTVLKEFFCCESWYRPSTPSSEFDTAVFSDQEKANLQLIQVYEDILDGIYPDSGNPYTPYYSRSWEYVISDSSTRVLTESDVYYLSIPELIIARNEIFARHGYCFTDDHLMQYFLQCSWYLPDVAPGRLDLISLNSTETKNVNFLLDYQDKREDLEELNNLDTTLNYRVESDMFYLYLPAYWKEFCVTSADGHNLRFYEKYSRNSIGGGHLFSIEAIPMVESYDGPSYSYLGTVTDGTQDNYWQLIVTYPTDVQWEIPYQELYTKMYEENQRILSTLTMKDGYFLMP